VLIAFKIKLAAGPRRLQGRELYVLPLNAHFESVFAVNLVKLSFTLEGGTDLVGGQKRVAARLQTLDSERGSPPFSLSCGIPGCRNPQEGPAPPVPLRLLASGEIRVV